MLTESEKRWLRNKRLRGFRYDICRWCFAYPVASWERAPSPCVIYCHDNGKPALCEGLHSARGLKDALVFSDRVAARLSKYAEELGLELCCVHPLDIWENAEGHDPLCKTVCPIAVACELRSRMSCAANLLKAARLAVEDEMDEAD